MVSRIILLSLGLIGIWPAAWSMASAYETAQEQRQNNRNTLLTELGRTRSQINNTTFIGNMVATVGITGTFIYRLLPSLRRLPATPLVATVTAAGMATGVFLAAISTGCFGLRHFLRQQSRVPAIKRAIDQLDQTDRQAFRAQRQIDRTTISRLTLNNTNLERARRVIAQELETLKTNIARNSTKCTKDTEPPTIRPEQRNALIALISRIFKSRADYEEPDDTVLPYLDNAMAILTQNSATTVTSSEEQHAIDQIMRTCINQGLQENDLKMLKLLSKYGGALHLASPEIINKCCNNNKLLYSLALGKECVVCMELFGKTGEHEPRARPCGHLLCKACYNTLEKQTNSCCPTCRDDRKTKKPGSCSVM